MMRIDVERYFDDGKMTRGLIWVDDRFVCYSVEDTFRPEKIKGETRIPSGVYDVRLRKDSPMSRRYANRYPDIHEGMLWLQNVPDFEWIYFHVGNTSEHTEGCILCTNTADADKDFGGRSGEAYTEFYRLVVGAAERGELTVRIVDRDRKAA